jgi:hypothetical protein
MLMYEPNNTEGKQYIPLIDYMLAQEQQQSWSFSSDDSSDDEDNSRQTKRENGNPWQKDYAKMMIVGKKRRERRFATKCINRWHKK